MQSLDVVLKYQNPEVVLRFSEDYKISPADAEEIFLEMKRWLWLSAKKNSEIQIPLFDEALAIDLMWHTFILFTRDYAEFCDQHFGHFLHHAPKLKSEQLAWEKYARQNPEDALQERLAELRRVYECIHDELGAETLVKWCEEFPERFKSLESGSPTDVSPHILVTDESLAVPAG